MRDDLPAPAFRLLTALPVTTHVNERAIARPGPQHRGYTKRDPDKRGPAGIPRPVQVGRRTFPSITEAKTRLRISPKRLYAMLDSGEAQYV